MPTSNIDIKDKANLNIKYESPINYETLSEFEEICISTKDIEQVKSWLKYKSDGEISREILSGFFRALESNNSSIALYLLSIIPVNDIANHKINGGDATLDEYHEDYLNKITKVQHYKFCFNRYAKGANVALVLAAAMPDSYVFTELLKIPKLKDQLSSSAKAAFLSATLSDDGSVKNDINQDVAFQLLDIPKVLDYAKEREFDFADLVNEFKIHKKTPEEFPTPLSFTTASRSTTITPLNFFELNRSTPRSSGPDTPRPYYHHRSDTQIFRPIQQSMSNQTLSYDEEISKYTK